MRVQYEGKQRTTEYSIRVGTDKRTNDRDRQRTAREIKERENEMRRWESQFRVIFRVDLTSCAVQPRNDTVV